MPAPVHPLADLIEQLAKLPGVGFKSAQRLAFFFLSLPQRDVARFAEVLTDTRSRIRYCDTCFNISYTPTCAICQDATRNKTHLCVVAEPRDILAIERTGEFSGVYHVLGGLISPIDGVHPEVLRIKELLGRVKAGPISEIILAINPTIEGDATVLYLENLLRSIQVPITKLAYGLPVGADMDYADDLTLKKAFIGRRSN